MPAANVLTEPIEEDDVRIGCVLHLDPAKDLVILLDVGGDKALPGWRKLSGVGVDLEEGTGGCSVATHGWRFLVPTIGSPTQSGRDGTGPGR